MSRVAYELSLTTKHAITCIDYVDNFIFIASIALLLIGLDIGGSVESWDSWTYKLSQGCRYHSWAFFHVHQASPICKGAHYAHFLTPLFPPPFFASPSSSFRLPTSLTKALDPSLQVRIKPFKIPLH